MNDVARSPETIFGEAIEIASSDGRRAFLAQACQGDAELQAAVAQLVENHFRSGSFLESPPTPPWGGATVDQPSIIEHPGTVIGPYKLLQQIGEGGMGVVFMAEQTHPVQRTVALKIIKPGMDTRQVIARFEAERQAVAMMDHPNIAKVLDAGATDSGRPYFVMELVKGVPITKYCDDKHLPLRARLELFTQVCQAVQHAHQKGIIHRDIKPNNVLVAEYDNRAVPKVIDFGVAKATAQRLTERTMFTEFGQVLGTMEYMSPEQSKFNQLDIDTRSDVYSLGVLLYELLAGSTPFGRKRLNEAAFDEMLRIIREEEPPKPSTRLSSLSLGERAGERESLASIAANRGLEPLKLNRLVQGELDWIVMKSLEKDRNRRYETASSLAEDIGHHLNDEPVAARPASTFYRFRKTMRRNKIAFAAGGAVLAALVVGLGLSTWLFVRERAARVAEVEQRTEAERQRKQAEANERKALTEASKSRQVARFLRDMLEGARTGIASGRDTTLLREIVDRTAERIGNDLRDQPEVEAELLDVVAWAYDVLGEYEQAEAMSRQALVATKRHYGGEHLKVAISLRFLGWVLLRQDKLAEAEATLRESLAMHRTLLQDDTQELGFLLSALASVLQEQRKLAEAEAMFREALAMRRKVFGNDHPAVAGTLSNLGASLLEQGKLSEAETMFREALAISRKHPDQVYSSTTTKLSNLAALLQHEGKWPEAQATYREALEMQRSLLGNEHPFVATMLEDLAGVLRHEGKLTEAEATYREALVVQRKVVESMPNNPNALCGLAKMLATCPFERLRDPGRAVELAMQAVELVPQTGSCWIALGVARYRAGDWQGVVEALGKSMELRNGGDSNDFFFLAMAHSQLGHKGDSRKWYDQAVDWMDKNQPNNDELRRIRAEAAELLGISEPQSSTEPKPPEAETPNANKPKQVPSLNPKP